MKRKIKLIISIATLGGIAIAFQNCSNVDFQHAASQAPVQSLETPPTGRPPVAQATPPPTVYEKCSSGNLHPMVVDVSFGKDSRTCDWQSNGNLDQREMHIQARREQTQSFSLPAGATICAVDFEFEAQRFKYDDHFAFTLNNAVLASSYPWIDVDNSNRQRLQEKNGFLIFDWNRIAGLRWDDRYNGTYCAGSEDGLSECSWPRTDTLGTINMDFNPKLIQDIMTMNPSARTHSFGFIVTGDNDEDSDCKHEPIHFKATVSYAL